MMPPEKPQPCLAAIADSSGDAVIGVRLDGAIETWNFAAERLFGCPAPEAAGRPMTLFEPPGMLDDIDGILGSVAHKRAAEEVHQSQRQLARKARLTDLFATLTEREIFAAVLAAVLEETQIQKGIFGYIGGDGAILFPNFEWGTPQECPASGTHGESTRIPRAEREVTINADLEIRMVVYDGAEALEFIFSAGAYAGRYPAGELGTHSYIVKPLAFGQFAESVGAALAIIITSDWSASK